jgi:hypothetical protein
LTSWFTPEAMKTESSPPSVLIGSPSLMASWAFRTFSRARPGRVSGAAEFAAP